MVVHISAMIRLNPSREYVVFIAFLFPLFSMPDKFQSKNSFQKEPDVLPSESVSTVEGLGGSV